jgi:serine/threonine protein kinase
MPAWHSCLPACPFACCSSEFRQVKELGKGGFSIVFRGTHRIDGCEYALKRTKSPVSDNKERNAWLQVRAAGRGQLCTICNRTAAAVRACLTKGSSIDVADGSGCRP